MFLGCISVLVHACCCCDPSKQGSACCQCPPKEKCPVLLSGDIHRPQDCPDNVCARQLLNDNPFFV